MKNEHTNTVRTFIDEHGDMFMHIEDFEIGLISQIYYELEHVESGLSHNEIELIKKFVECIQESIDGIINGEDVQ